MKLSKLIKELKKVQIDQDDNDPEVKAITGCGGFIVDSVYTSGTFIEIRIRDEQYYGSGHMKDEET